MKKFIYRANFYFQLLNPTDPIHYIKYCTRCYILSIDKTITQLKPLKVVYNKGMYSHLSRRVGTFLILAGIGLLMVFVTYELGGSSHFDYFFISLILLFIGIRLRFRGKPYSPGSRFKSIRNLSNKINQKDQ